MARNAFLLKNTTDFVRYKDAGMDFALCISGIDIPGNAFPVIQTNTLSGRSHEQTNRILRSSESINKGATRINAFGYRPGGAPILKRNFNAFSIRETFIL